MVAGYPVAPAAASTSARHATSGIGSTGVPTEASTMTARRPRPREPSAGRAGRADTAAGRSHPGPDGAIGPRLTVRSRRRLRASERLVALDRARPAVLGRVHREVGAAQQLGCAGRATVGAGDTDAHGGDQPPSPRSTGSATAARSVRRSGAPPRDREGRAARRRTRRRRAGQRCRTGESSPGAGGRRRRAAGRRARDRGCR